MSFKKIVNYMLGVSDDDETLQSTETGSAPDASESTSVGNEADTVVEVGSESVEPDNERDATVQDAEIGVVEDDLGTFLVKDKQPCPEESQDEVSEENYFSANLEDAATVVPAEDAKTVQADQESACPESLKNVADFLCPNAAKNELVSDLVCVYKEKAAAGEQDVSKPPTAEDEGEEGKAEGAPQPLHLEVSDGEEEEAGTEASGFLRPERLEAVYSDSKVWEQWWTAEDLPAPSLLYADVEKEGEAASGGRKGDEEVSVPERTYASFDPDLTLNAQGWWANESLPAPTLLYGSDESERSRGNQVEVSTRRSGGEPTREDDDGDEVADARRSTEEEGKECAHLTNEAMPLEVESDEGTFLRSERALADYRPDKVVEPATWWAEDAVPRPILLFEGSSKQNEGRSNGAQQQDEKRRFNQELKSDATVLTAEEADVSTHCSSTKDKGNPTATESKADAVEAQGSTTDLFAQSHKKEGTFFAFTEHGSTDMPQSVASGNTDYLREKRLVASYDPGRLHEASQYWGEGGLLPRPTFWFKNNADGKPQKQRLVSITAQAAHKFYLEESRLVDSTEVKTMQDSDDYAMTSEASDLVEQNVEESDTVKPVPAEVDVGSKDHRQTVERSGASYDPYKISDAHSWFSPSEREKDQKTSTKGARAPGQYFTAMETNEGSVAKAKSEVNETSTESPSRHRDRRESIKASVHVREVYRARGNSIASLHSAVHKTKEDE